jgi:hypothetical protein
MTSSGSPTDLAGDSFDLLDESIVWPLGSDLLAGGCSPAKNLLDAAVSAPEGPGEQNAILFSRSMLEDDSKFLVRPRFALVALVETCRLLQLDEALLHDGELLVKRQVPDLIPE